MASSFIATTTGVIPSMIAGRRQGMVKRDIKLTIWPHLPQLIGSKFMFVQRLLQHDGVAKGH
jgi:hypothetical protein